MKSQRRGKLSRGCRSILEELVVVVTSRVGTRLMQQPAVHDDMSSETAITDRLIYVQAYNWQCSSDDVPVLSMKI